MRTRTLLLLATTLTLTTIVAAGVAAGGAASTAAPPSDLAPPSRDGPVTGALHASAMLRAWDHRREAAWTRDDVAALAALYRPSSRTGRHDVRDLRRWRERGLRVVGLRQQVRELRVRVETSRRLVLTVTDRTVNGIAVGHGRRTALPASTWARHRIRLLRAHGRWQVVEVLAQPAR
jgi:hypothetical protein